MKADDPLKAFGAVIGKALRPLPERARAYSHPDCPAMMVHLTGQELPDENREELKWP
jgi:hypothetical protein